MAERGSTHIWSMRALYVGLCLLVLFLQLLPLNTLARVWAVPDLMLLITFAWALRRPEYVPAGLVALIFLLADLLLQRPPGLWAALVLVGTETLKARAPGLRDLTFPAEWLTMAATLVSVTLAFRVILTLMLVPQAPLGLSLFQLLATLAAYPLVVLASRWLFGIHKRAPGEFGGLKRQRP